MKRRRTGKGKCRIENFEVEDLLDGLRLGNGGGRDVYAAVDGDHLGEDVENGL